MSMLEINERPTATDAKQAPSTSPEPAPASTPLVSTPLVPMTPAPTTSASTLATPATSASMPPAPTPSAPTTASAAPRATHSALITGAITGTLIGFREEGAIPLVLFPGQHGTAAVPAATTVDVHGTHVGHQVVLVFEKGDPTRPIIVGLMRNQGAWPSAEAPGQVEVDADGDRLVVTAREQLVLRCGKASITLTKAGKVLLQGEYVSTSSTGVVRVKGGSVQIN